jgi:hypothetical protein
MHAWRQTESILNVIVLTKGYWHNLHFYYHEDIKSRLNSETACYNAGHNLASPRLLYENVKIKIYKTLLPVPLYAFHVISRYGKNTD